GRGGAAGQGERGGVGCRHLLSPGAGRPDADARSDTVPQERRQCKILHPISFRASAPAGSTMPGLMTATSTSEPRSLALGGDPDALRAWAEDAGRELGEALRTVLGALPGAGEGPIELAKRLGLNRDVAGRVLLSVPRPPLEVLADIPGPEPLRRFLAAARRAGAGEAAVERAARAVEDFQ